MATTDTKPVTTTDTTPAKKTHGEVFLEKVQEAFVAQMGSEVAWTPLQKALAQHLFVKMDLSMRELEIKRASDNRKQNDPPITWANVNMLDLANEAKKIVQWEVDAELPNHVNVMPYLNGRTKKYDVSLTLGYEGVRHVHTRFAINPPSKVSFHLVHEDDEFDIDESAGWQRPIFKRGNYFKPGEVIGGFGHIEFDNPRLNIVAPVEYREFEKARAASKNVQFWGGEKDEWVNGRKTGQKVQVEGFTKEMMYKTVVLRVCRKHLPLDPAKINVSEVHAFTNAEAEAIEAEFREEVSANANREPLALEPSTGEGQTQQTAEPQGSLVAGDDFPE